MSPSPASFLTAIDPTAAGLDSGQLAALAGFSTLLGGGLGSLAGVNANGAATAAQNEALNNDAGSADHTADAVQNGGAVTKSGNALIDWVKWTYANPIGDIGRGINYFLSVGSRNGQNPPADPNQQLDPTSGPKNGGPSAPAPVTALAALGCMFTEGVGCVTSALLGAAPVSAPPPSNWNLSSGNSDGGSGSGTSGQGGANNPTGPQNLGNNVQLYPDGSLRTPDGKFASVSGSPPPGTTAASQFADLLSSNGINVVGQEVVVNGPLGFRRYDIVTQDASGALHGIEVKSGSATPNTYQQFTDQFVNQFGATAAGRFAGKSVSSATTVYVP
jgi:filamentous hemagglutinin